MNTTKLGFAGRIATAGAIVVAAELAAPTMAFATGADILFPKPAEFIPALIAFIIIWIILAKMAWPIIIKALDARQEKIESDLKAAEDAKADAQESARQSKDAISDAQREAADIVAAAKREGEEERKKAMVELSGHVVDLSVEIASKIIGDALDEKEQRELAKKYLLEVGDLNED